MLLTIPIRSRGPHHSTFLSKVHATSQKRATQSLISYCCSVSWPNPQLEVCSAESTTVHDRSGLHHVITFRCRRSHTGDTFHSGLWLPRGPHSPRKTAHPIKGALKYRECDFLAEEARPGARTGDFCAVACEEWPSCSSPFSRARSRPSPPPRWASPPAPTTSTRNPSGRVVNKSIVLPGTDETLLFFLENGAVEPSGEAF